MTISTFYEAVITPPAATAGIDTGETINAFRSTSTVGKWATVADYSRLDIVSDIYIAVRVSLDNWASGASQTLVSKYGTTAGTCSYALEVSATGELKLTHSSDGTTAKVDTSTATLPAMGLVNGQTYWLLASLDVDNGATGRTCKFYWAYDQDTPPCGDNPWQQLGSNVTTAGITSIYSSTTNLYVGRLGNDTNRAIGYFYRCFISNALPIVHTNSGPWPQVDIDFTSVPAASTSFTETQGATVSVTGDIVTLPSGWRFAIELLVSAKGNRVGYCAVGTAQVDQYAWLDLTGYIDAVQWQQGGQLSTSGYPYSTPGQLNFSINNISGLFSSWATNSYSSGIINNPNINREWASNALVRVSFFKSTAVCYAFIDTSLGATTLARANWRPMFTGFVESWKETLRKNTSEIDVIVIETLARLASSVNIAGTGTMSANQTMIKRLASILYGDILTPELITNGSDIWKFPIVEQQRGSSNVGGTGSGYGDWNYAPYQARTAITNVLQEVNLTTQSFKNLRAETAGDGSLKISGDQYAFYSTVSNFAYVIDPAVFVRFTSAAKKVLADGANFQAGTIDAYYTDPLILSETSDYVTNHVEFTAVGGVKQVSESPESIGKYGKRSYVRTDNICVRDTDVADSADKLRAQLDGWVSTPSAIISQVLCPGAITVEQQHAAQRWIEVGTFSILDWYGQPEQATPALRVFGKTIHVINTVSKISDGIKWTTTTQIMPRFNYIPNSYFP